MYFCISCSFALIEMFDAFGSLDILNLFSLFWCRKWPAQKTAWKNSDSVKDWWWHPWHVVWEPYGHQACFCGALVLWPATLQHTIMIKHSMPLEMVNMKIILSVCNMQKTHGRFYMFMGYKLAKMVLWTWIWLWSRTGSGIPLRNPGQRTCYIDAPAITTFEC